MTMFDGPRDRRPADVPGPPGRFADDLVGLDPDDPEARAFAAHLDRMERVSPSFTVEGQLAGVRDFAESANRADGTRRVAAVLLVALVLLGTGYVIFETLEVVLATLL
jgi:hypothetical protein